LKRGIDQNAQLSGQCRFGTSKAACASWNLLVIPSGKALLYAEPIYAQARPQPHAGVALVGGCWKLAGPARLRATFEAALSSLFGEASHR